MNNSPKMKMGIFLKAVLKEKAELENDPLFKLFNTIEEINDVLNLPLFTKYLYLNMNEVESILYDKEEVLNMDKKDEKKDLSFFFYLFLLIKHEPDIVNYIYSFDFIKEINSKKKNNNNYLRNIIISKINLTLITNFKDFDDNEHDQQQEEQIGKLTKENEEEIDRNMKLIEYMDLNLTKKSIKDNKIDELYIEIIIQLIKNDKLSDYEFSFNIISQLDFEKIDLNEIMFAKLSNVLNSKDKNVEKYFIYNYIDLLDEKIVDFHYILLKYILKSSVYIYQIPFLLKIHKNIIKIIKSNIYELIYKGVPSQEKGTNKLEYVLEKYSDLLYYFNKYLDLKLSLKEEQKNNNELKLELKNKKDNLNRLKKEVNNKSTKPRTGQTGKIKSLRIGEREEFDPVKDILSRLFQYSIFLIHTNEKGNEPYIIIDKILLGKGKIEIKEDVLKEIEKETTNENYKFFLNFIHQIKIRIKNEFICNYCLKIKLEFEIDENERLNEQSYYNISCIYTFYNPIDKSKKIFRDNDILNSETNSTLNGFSYMIDEINDELFESLEYKCDENKNITELKNNNINSNIKISHDSRQNNIYSINSDNNNSYESSNKSLIQKENVSTKPFTDYEYFNKEAEEEVIVAPIKIINDKDSLSDFLIELNSGDFISFGKDNKLIGYDHKYNRYVITKLDECIYNISEKNPDDEKINEIIVCCVSNIYLIKVKDNKCISSQKIQISQMNYFLCSELKKDHYVISGETSTIYCVDIFTDKNKKPLSLNYKKINNDIYRSGIKINDNIIALTSNSIMKHGKDNLSLYNFAKEKEETKKIFGYSYFYGTNGLSLMNIKGKLILLCACKKYFPEQKNGIVIIDLSTTNKDILEEYFDTDNFEVNCFKPILDVKNKSMDKNGEINEFVGTEYFFVGGFDEEKGEAVIQLYKAYYDNEENKISIEYLQDIEFDFKWHSIFKGQGSIISIQQSKINGNILVNCSSGNIYLFTKPNIQYYLKETDIK